jgi:formamidopyrimidine-DNA glycosylase
MPEGPEVAMTRDYLYYKLKNTTIKKITVLKGRYVHNPIKGIEHIDGKNITIKDINSKGKFLWFELDLDGVNGYIMNTLGLSGSWGFIRNNNSKVKFTIKRKNKLYNLYFNDQINYGTLKITTDISELNEKINSIEIDLLKSDYNEKTISKFINSFIDKKVTNKDTLIVDFMMNQNKGESLGSGLGNYLVPEILYHSKLSPYRKLGSLTEQDIKILTGNIKKTIKLAFYKNDTGYMKKFTDFLNTYETLIKNNKFSKYLKDVNINEEKFVFNVYSKTKDNCGNDVRIDIIIGGRKTHWVPNIQK